MNTAKTVLNYGDPVDGIYVLPHPTMAREYTHEIRPAVAVSFSHPGHRTRDWGWRGDVLVRFADGRQSWQSY